MSKFTALIERQTGDPQTRLSQGEKCRKGLEEKTRKVEDQNTIKENERKDLKTDLLDNSSCNRMTSSSTIPNPVRQTFMGCKH